MGEKKKYRVAVTEVLRKIVVVEAADENEAHSRVRDAYQNCEVILTGEDCDGAEFSVLGETGADVLPGAVKVESKPTEEKKED